MIPLGGVSPNENIFSAKIYFFLVIESFRKKKSWRIDHKFFILPDFFRGINGMSLTGVWILAEFDIKAIFSLIFFG